MATETAVNKQSLFGTTDTNVQLRNPYLGVGVTSGADIYLPYCVNADTHHGSLVVVNEGPFNNGVFHSTDYGKHWQMEAISSGFQASSPLVCKSKTSFYFLATRGMKTGCDLWFSRKPITGGAWDTLKEITKTFATEYGRYVAVTEDDTIHVSWMDLRHNKTRFNVSGPNVENDDIVYCHLKETDGSRSKDIVLSSGLLYSYSPSMSVEGSNIVVAWAGIRSADNRHNEYEPNDLYYVTSKDGGNTWSTPLNVTDRVKEGIVSGKPQVILLDGVIHLLFVQGTMESSQQLGAGLTKLNKGPWPIYYTQRAFPN